jgi:tRNA 2-selenouridine synthase
MSTGRHGVIKIEHLEEYSQFDEIIDVRTPAEFAEDHIPGSINCPVLDNEQRIEVGTLYKQDSPFRGKRIGAAYVAENIAYHLRHSFQDRPKDWKPLIVCWRGGQRSGSMTLIFRPRRLGRAAVQGGYKDYRQLVIEQLAELPRQMSFKVICGATGSGKSRVLQAIGTGRRTGPRSGGYRLPQGFGPRRSAELPGQPSQKMFETRLLSRRCAA